MAGRKGLFDGKPGGMVRGHYWSVRMSNDAIFSLWTPYGDVTRAEARAALVAFANSSTEPDDPAYLPEDVGNIWRSIKEPTGG